MQTQIETPEEHARRVILYALNRSARDVWTQGDLATHHGISIATAGRVLAELTGAGLIRRLPGEDDEYTAVGAGY